MQRRDGSRSIDQVRTGKTNPARKESPVRISTLLRQLLAVSTLFISGFIFDDNGTLVIRARPLWLRPRCARCGMLLPKAMSICLVTAATQTSSSSPARRPISRPHITARWNLSTTIAVVPTRESGTRPTTVLEAAVVLAPAAVGTPVTQNAVRKLITEHANRTAFIVD